VEFEALPAASGQGALIRAYVALPGGLDVARIDLTSVQLMWLGRSLQARQDDAGLPNCDGDGKADRFCDQDGNGQKELVLVFGPLSEPLTGPRAPVPFVITGRLEDGTDLSRFRQ